jgi:hypothetical protein
MMGRMGTTSAVESDRVRRHTSEQINRKVDQRIAASIHTHARQPRVEIDRRIRQLDGEWDIERLLETNAATLALIGVALGATVSRKWLLLSGTVLGFLLLHGIQGWCPPVPVLRRLGVRTPSEIDRERLALRYLRGDFEDRLPPPRERRRLGALVGAA